MAAPNEKVASSIRKNVRIHIILRMSQGVIGTFALRLYIL